MVFALFEAQWFFTIEASGNRCVFLYPNYHAAYQQIDAIVYSYLPFILMTPFQHSHYL